MDKPMYPWDGNLSTRPSKAPSAAPAEIEPWRIERREVIRWFPVRSTDAPAVLYGFISLTDLQLNAGMRPGGRVPIVNGRAGIEFTELRPAHVVEYPPGRMATELAIVTRCSRGFWRDVPGFIAVGDDHEPA